MLSRIQMRHRTGPRMFGSCLRAPTFRGNASPLSRPYCLRLDQPLETRPSWDARIDSTGGFWLWLVQISTSPLAVPLLWPLLCPIVSQLPKLPTRIPRFPTWLHPKFRVARKFAVLGSEYPRFLLPGADPHGLAHPGISGTAQCPLQVGSMDIQRLVILCATATVQHSQIGPSTVQSSSSLELRDDPRRPTRLDFGDLWFMVTVGAPVFCLVLFIHLDKTKRLAGSRDVKA